MKSPVVLVAEFALVLVLLAGAAVYPWLFSGPVPPDRPVLAVTSAGFWGGTRIGTSFVLYADGVALYPDEHTTPASWRQVRLAPSARDELIAAAHQALLPVRNCFANLPLTDGPAINFFLRHGGQVIIGGFRGSTRNPPSPQDCRDVTALYLRLSSFASGASVPATRIDAHGQPPHEWEWIRAVKAVWPSAN